MKNKTIAFLLPNGGFKDCCMILEHGQYNGYVAIPPEHPLYRASYNSAEIEQLRVYGGVTFAGGIEQLYGAMKCLDMRTIPSNWWVFGFDTCHYGDNPVSWDFEAVAQETRRLQQQLEELFAQSKNNQ